jgi:hypothetical protein
MRKRARRQPQRRRTKLRLSRGTNNARRRNSWRNPRRQARINSQPQKQEQDDQHKRQRSQERQPEKLTAAGQDQQQ